MPEHPQAGAILGLGIGAIILTSLTGLGFILGIVTIIMGSKARKEIEAADLGGSGKVTAGIVMSWISIGLTTLALALFGMFLALLMLL
ncbi:hypothetical protein [Austwickia sp. TVS 96-490-7B]|uniref:hypothetical protein n=1 Tax=Austwickia sp. TVS 96-490-7B TaxID=2830843 RepID=UPI001C57F397|nr:hypothetical protein [Austwickia sp. TVS 96-490-7B]